MKNLYSIFFCFFLCLSWTYAQQELSIQTNKSFYVSGEQLGLVISNSSANSAEIIYVEVLSQSGEVLVRKMLKSNDIAATALINIPLDWKSDWYILRAYNLWLPNLIIKDLAYKVLPIYNEFDNSPASQKLDLKELSLSNSSGFAVQGLKEGYSKDEEVKLSLSSSGNSEFQYVATVMDESSYRLHHYFEALAPTVSIAQFNAAPQDGKIVSKPLFLGQLKEERSNGLGAFYIAEEGKSNFISFNQSNVFAMEVDDFYGDKHGQLVSIEPLGGISYLEPEMFSIADGLKLPNIDFPTLAYPDLLIDYLENSRKRRIIRDLFDMPNLFESAPTFELPSFTKPDKSYDPREYVRFTDTRNFITEIVTLIKFRNIEGKNQMRLLLERNTVAVEAPVIMMNGFILTDPEELMTYPLDQIERIDIYRKERSINEQFGLLGRNGVIAFYTKDPNQRPKTGNTTMLSGLSRGDQSIKITASEKGPNLASTLFWKGLIQSEGSQNANISFPVGDNKGRYFIILNQMTSGSNSQGIYSFDLNSAN